MKGLQTYLIPFIGLKQGIHPFNYTINKDFFINFPDSLVQEGSILVDLNFDKKENFFVLDFNIKGIVNVECDRCLDYFDLPVQGQYTIIIKFNDELRNENDMGDSDIIYISRNDTVIDVTQLIYEFVNLSVPMHKTHSEDSAKNSTCNPKIIGLLKNYTSDASEKETDPRWNELKKLKTK